MIPTTRCLRADRLKLAKKELLFPLDSSSSFKPVPLQSTISSYMEPQTTQLLISTLKKPPYPQSMYLITQLALVTLTKPNYIPFWVSFLSQSQGYHFSLEFFLTSAPLQVTIHTNIAARVMALKTELGLLLLYLNLLVNLELE